MSKLQVQLDKRLAALKKRGSESADRKAGVTTDQIKATLTTSGILSKSGKLRTFPHQ